MTKEAPLTREQAVLKYISNLVKGTEFEGKVFLAGGAVRDEIMGTSVKDIDLVVAMPDGGIKFAEWVTRKTDTHSPGSNPVTFEKFGTAKFNLRGKSLEGIDISDVDVEVVMTRGEEYTAGSRKPSVKYSDLKSDAFRRDLTVNSLFKDIVTGEILDLTGKGVSDIEKGIVRTPLDPDETFKDDPLRMLRAIRFAVKYNWKMPKSLARALKSNADSIQNISNERIRDELNKILLTDSPDIGVKLLSESGLMKHIIPELDATREVKQEAGQDSVYDHSLMVVKNSPKRVVPRLAALMLGIGKPATKDTDSSGQIHFPEYENAGADMAKDILRRLKYKNEEISSISTIVKNHTQLKQAGKNGEHASDKQLRKLATELGGDLVDTLAVIHADNISYEGNESSPNQITNIAKRIETIKTAQTGTGKPNLPINGNDVIKLLNIRPGPMISTLLSSVTDAWYENPELSRDDALKLVKNKYEEKVKSAIGKLPDTILNPITKNKIKPTTAMKYDSEHPAKKLVIRLIQQTLDGES